MLRRGISSYSLQNLFIRRVRYVHSDPVNKDRGTPLRDRLDIDESLAVDENRLAKILGDKQATKFHLSNLPEKVNVQQFSDLLSDNGIKYKRIVKIFGKPYAKIFFDNPDQAKHMLKRLSQFCIDRKKLYINQTIDNKGKFAERKISDKRIEDVTTPWWDIPYTEQLQKKHEIAEEILSTTSKTVINENAKNMRSVAWINDLNARAMDQDRYPSVCKFTGVSASPVQTGYRNKISFTIGHDATDQITIGFVMGKFKEGITHLGDPSGAINSPIHPTAQHFRQLFEEYFRNDSKLPVFDRIKQVGFWRGLEIRSFNSGENSLTFQVEPTAASEDQIEDEIGKLVQILVLNSQYKENTSIFFQEWKKNAGAPNNDDIPRLAYGKSYIHENLNIGGSAAALSFRVQPTAFFQTNTASCEVLYSKIVDLCKEIQTKEDEKLSVLDICCGTGTIGLCVASAISGSSVYGIDLVESAIQDANHNAKLNNISTAKYLVGDVRQHIKHITSSIDDNSRCIAIVDPPRGGVHPAVLKALNSCRKIDRLIYVACNPNTIEFCTTALSSQFKPVSSCVVDMFPHTAQMEMIVCFDRIERKTPIKKE